MNTAKTGQLMIGAGFVIGLIMLSTFFSDQLDSQRNPNRDPASDVSGEVTTVSLQRNRQGHYVTSGFINNRAAEFLLDTGATDVVVPAAYAEPLGLRRGKAGRAMTANGAVTVYATMIDSLRIGDITLYNVPASINPAMQGGILLGMSALSRVEFRQSGDQLTLRQYH